MNEYFIANYAVKGLWGYKDYPITFFNDVNVIIGPNASGKTTLINILYDTLSGNLSRLCRTEFSEVVIGLQSFSGDNKECITVARNANELKVSIGKDSIKFPMLAFQQSAEGRDIMDVPPELLRRRIGVGLQEIRNRLRGLVPAVWLPVSRRLPIGEEDEGSRRPLHRKSLESVDECLARLTESLQQYRLSLNSDLAELRKEFQRHALENILYDKKHDRWTSSLEPPSNTDQEQLMKAFRDVGFVDTKMEARISEHFAAAREVIAKMSQKEKTRTGVEINIETIMIIPLIARTRAMVGFAAELERERGELFKPLEQYTSIASGFLKDKEVSVSDKGDLIIMPKREGQGALEWRHLSSGEKQILILLTQALVSGRSPVVYVADEPELSLHVIWQEKLLSSLTKLAGRCQFIVATHSPDIAAGFGDKVIDLARIG
jgi:predicted ATP-dependent endonuclease of OLD family